MRKTQFLQRIAAGALAGLLAFTGLPVSALAAAPAEGGEEIAESVLSEEADDAVVEEDGETVSEVPGEGAAGDIAGASAEGGAEGVEEDGETVSEVPGEGAKEDIAGTVESAVEIAGEEEEPVPDLEEEEEGIPMEAPEEAGEGSEAAAGEVYSVDVTPKNRSVSLTAQTDEINSDDTWLVYTTGSLDGLTSVRTSWDDDGFDQHSGTGFEIYSFNSGNNRIYAQNDYNGSLDWNSADYDYDFTANYVKLEPETTYSYALATKTEEYDSGSYRTVYTFSFLTAPQSFTTLADPETTSIGITDFKAEKTGYNEIKVGFALTNPNDEVIESARLCYKLDGDTEYEEMTLGLFEGRYSGRISTGGKNLTVYPSVTVMLKGGAKTITLPEQTFAPANKSNIAKSLKKTVRAGTGSVSLELNIAYPSEEDVLYAYMAYRKKGTEEWKYSGTYDGDFTAVQDEDDEPTGRGKASVLISGLEEAAEYEYRIEIYAGYRSETHYSTGNLLYASENIETISTKSNVIHTAADFPDDLFLEAVKEASKNANSNLSGDALLSDVALEKISRLNISADSGEKSYIQDITGIAFLPNLTYLRIRGHDVKEGVSALSGLTRLNYIYLEFNEITEMPDLTELSGLSDLDLEGNLISDSVSDIAAKLPEGEKDRAVDIHSQQRKTPVLTLAKDGTYFPVIRETMSKSLYPFLAKVSGLKSSYRTYTLELTIDGETLLSEPTTDAYSPFYIRDVGLYGQPTARIRLVDHTGHVYVDQDNVELIFEKDEFYPTVTYASAGDPFVSLEGYISGSHEESAVSEIALVDENGKSVGVKTYSDASVYGSDPRYQGVFDSIPSEIQVECTHIDTEFSLNKVLPAGEYSAQCKVNGKTIQFATLIIGDDQVVKNITLASINYSRSNHGGYDNWGKTVSICVLGKNLKMADAVPTLKLNGKTMTETGYTAAIPYDTDGFIYTLKKAAGWEDASIYDVVFSEKIVDTSDGKLYYGSPSFEPIRAQYYNWKLNPGKYEVHLKESAEIPEGTPVKVILYTNSGYSTIKASAESTVESGNVIYFTFTDPTGAVFEPVRNSTAYLRYEFGGKVNRAVETSDIVYWYNYHKSGSGEGGGEEKLSPFFTDVNEYQYVPLRALTFSLYVPTDQMTEDEIWVSIRGTNSSVSLSGGTVSGKYTVYKGSLNTEALSEGIYSLEARQGNSTLAEIDRIFLLEQDKFYQYNQRGAIYPDELYTTISSPTLYKLYTDEYSSKPTEAQALEYAKANFKFTFHDGNGKELGEFAPSSAVWSGWILYTWFDNIPDLNDYFNLWVKVTDKNGNPGYYLDEKMSFYAAYSDSSYYSEEYGYLCTESGGLLSIEEGDAKVYQKVDVWRAALPATAYFTEINRADVISSFTIKQADSEDYYHLTAADVSKIKADHAYSLHILSADGRTYDSITGYFAASTTKTVAVKSVAISGQTFVAKGQTMQLGYTVSPADAAVSEITWTSSNEEVAKISNSGLVTGVEVGEATITLTVNGSLSRSFKMTVHDYAIAKDGAKITEGLTMNLADEGVTLQLLNGTTPVLNGITWSSANESVAVVDKAGKVSPRGKGETTITAQTKTGSASVKLTVTAGLTGITLSKSEGAVAFEQGDAIKLSYTLNPKGAEAVSITAALSSDEKLAEITINQTARTISIQALKTGSDDIVIKAVDKEGKEVSAVFKLTVVEPVDLSWVENALAPTAYIFATTAKTLGEEIPLSLLNENKNNPGYRFEWEDPDIDLSSYAGSSIGRFMLKYTIPAQKEGYPDYQRSLSISRRFISLGSIRLLVHAAAPTENTEEKTIYDGDTVAPGTVLRADLFPELDGDEYGYYAASAIDDGGAEGAEKALEDLLKTCSYAWKGKGETGTTASFAPKNAGALNLTGTITLGKIKYTDTFKCNVSGAGIGEITVGAPFTDAENSEGDQYYLAALDSLKALSTPPLMQVKVSEAKKFTAVSSDPKVLKIKAGTAADEKYPVTLEALAEGTAYVTLTVTDKDGGTLSERVKFVITNPDANLSAASLTLNWKNRAGTSFAILPNEGYEVYDAAIGRDDMSLERQSFRTEDEAGNLKENPTDQFRLHPYKNVDGTVKALNTKGTLKNVTLTIRLIPEGQSVTDESNITAIEKTLTIKVEEKNPVVKVAQTAAVNQYYQYDSEYSAGALRITTAESLEAAELSGGDFSITDDEENTSEKSGLYAYQVFAVKNDASQKSTTLKMTFPDYQDKDGKDLVLESKLTVKTAVSAPKYKLAASSVTLYPAAGISEADAEVIMASGRRVGFAVVSADAGKTGIEVDTSAEPIRVSAPASAKGGSVKLTLTPEEMNTANTKAKPVTLNLSVKVNAKTPTLALGAKTIVLNGHEELWENARAAASVQISGAPGAAIDPAALSIAAAKSTDQKSVDALKYMDTSFAEGRLYLSLREGISANGLKKGTYKFMVSYALSDTAKAQGALTVNVVDTAPAKAITLKAGRTTIDLLRRDADNYYAGFTARLSAAQGKVVDAHVLGAAAGKFYAEVNDGTGEIQIRAVAGVAISTKIKYVLPLRLTLETEDGVNTDVRGISVQVKPAQSKITFSFSPASFVTFPSARESFSVYLKAMIPNRGTPLTVEKVVLLKGGEDFSVDYYSDPDAGKSGVLTFSRLPGARKGKTSKLTFAVYCEDAGVDSPSQTAAYSIRVK